MISRVRVIMSKQYIWFYTKKQNICHFKMELTMRQIGDKMQYTEAQREEVRQMAEFV